MPDSAFPGRRATISAARRDLVMNINELWLAYVGLGGNAGLTVLQEWIEGTADIPDRDYDYLAQGLNDAFVERGQHHPVAYCEDLAAG